jgi:signal transduction histidine kinase
MMQQMNAVGRLATLGQIIVLLALMGLAFWTTAMTLKLSGAVKEAVSVNTMLEQAHYDLGTEESLAREYRLHPSLTIRSQHQQAATALVKDLQAASANEVGEPPGDRDLVADVLSEHRRYLLAAAQLFAAVDAGDTARIRTLEQTTIDPLFQQMQQQVSALDNEHSQEALQRLTELDQTQHKIFTTTPIVLIIGLGLFGLCWAVLQTYRRKLEEATQAELAQLQETARVKTQQVEEQRQLNQLKDHILLHVSHELRTPLTSVAGYVELLQQQQGKLDAQTLASWVDGVKQGSDELEQLINSILDAALVEHDRQCLKLEPTPVAPLVRKVLASFDPEERQAYSLRLELPEHVTVWADQLALQRVLRNVLGNAFKYAPQQSPISIRADLCRPSSGNADEHVCLSVQDAGPGIPPDEVPLLFQKFARLKRDLAGAVRGSGLGLYISRQLVEAMQGRMWVESAGRPGEGSCFYFTLPSTTQPASEERPDTVDVLVQDGPSRSLSGSNSIEPGAC